MNLEERIAAIEDRQAIVDVLTGYTLRHGTSGGAVRERVSLRYLGGVVKVEQGWKIARRRVFASGVEGRRG